MRKSRNGSITTDSMYWPIKQCLKIRIEIQVIWQCLSLSFEETWEINIAKKEFSNTVLWPDFVEKTKIWHLLAYSDFLQTEKKKKCSISTDFFGVWHFFKKQFSAAWDQKVHSLVWWLFEKKVKIQSNSNTLMYMIQ